MDNVLVSAIITTHNREPEFVLRAINSVLEQTYKNIEVIFVDDSTDFFPLREEIEQSVLKLSDTIKYIKNETSKGACVARNIGLKNATGYYVAFLDDDDEWLPNKIEEQIKGFTNNDIALVYSAIIINDEVEDKVTIQNKGKNGNIFKELIVNNIIGGTSNPLIKKECIDIVGCFDSEMQSSQDSDLWRRIAIKYPVKYIPIPLLIYHVHSEERISTNTDKKISGILRTNEKYKHYINGDRKLWYLRYKPLIPLYVKKGWRKKAFCLWLKCVIKSPNSVIVNTKLLFRIIFGVVA